MQINFTLCEILYHYLIKLPLFLDRRNKSESRLFSSRHENRTSCWLKANFKSNAGGGEGRFSTFPSSLLFPFCLPFDFKSIVSERYGGSDAIFIVLLVRKEAKKKSIAQIFFLTDLRSHQGSHRQIKLSFLLASRALLLILPYKNCSCLL